MPSRLACVISTFGLAWKLHRARCIRIASIGEERTLAQAQLVDDLSEAVLRPQLFRRHGDTKAAEALSQSVELPGIPFPRSGHQDFPQNP